MTEHRARSRRAEPPEIVELRRIAREQPELEAAANMQIELVRMQRRIQSRVSLPWIEADAARLSADLSAGNPIVAFADIPIDWTDFRLALRQSSDILLRFEAIDGAEHDHLLALGRDPEGLEPLVANWYTATSRSGAPQRHAGEANLENLDQVLVLAVRPFLARCAEILTQRPELNTWQRGACPICGWEPDFAVITPSAERRLVCGRCLAQWAFAPLDCPFCGNADRSRITSFATRDGLYRVSGCDVCKRYIKAYDARHASRPLLVAADAIATLPLDAAALQRGYSA